MKALYEARVGDLGPDDYLRIDCLACKRHFVMSGETLRLQRVRFYDPVGSLTRRFKCKGCKTKGRATISISWAR
jgi:hypothetical protein